MKRLAFPLFVLTLLKVAPVDAAGTQPAATSPDSRPAVRSWTALRDAGVIKQKFDYSCGVASLATLLHHYYGDPVDEAAVLQQIAATGPATFRSLSAAAAHFGYEARGYALSLEALRQLALPAIVFLYAGNDNHFSVLRSIDAHSVELADPSYGNRIYAIPDFLRLWTTRPSRDYPGRALVVLPRKAGLAGNAAFMRPIPAKFGGLPLRPIQP
ncbi:C39 family peptidase [Cupriavidus necator]